MASIRARLTAWNGLVLIFILLVFAFAAYIFLRQVTLAQVDRSLRQQMRASSIAAQEAQRQAHDTTAMKVLRRELEEVGLDVVIPAAITNLVVTAPSRVEQKDAQNAQPDDSTGFAAIDWTDLRSKVPTAHGDDPFTVRGADGGSRVAIQRIALGPRSILLISSQPLGEVAELLERARVAAWIALPIALLLSLGTGYALARRALAPVASMTSQARSIGARNLHDRLSIRNSHDELGQLAVTFNNVLERVDMAMEQQRRFTADASHELRTPIALIRAEADVALSGDTGHGAPQEEEYRAALNVIRDGSQQLSRVVNDLFLLARADAGQTLVTPHEMQLDELVRATAHGMRALAEEKGLQLDVRTNGSAPYHGDEEMLRRILRNLLDNAIKYSTGPGAVEVSLARDDKTYSITVTDNGQGISSEQQSHIFERFFRGDRARGYGESASGSGSGAGLGLAIAREIAELHGGRVELRRSSEKGSTFELILPATS
jgi:two-component system OmpR family sensor kinase